MKKVKNKKVKKIINKKEAEINQFVFAKKIVSESKKRSPKILKELQAGFEAISKYPKSVTIFGSARIKPGTKYYEKTKSLAKKISESGFAVITGGGPGLMQAANEGAFSGGGKSIGFNIELPHEQNINPYITDSLGFEYFFTRKFAMNFSGEAYICVPGGVGTMDEFFQILTLVQTKKIEKVPIILVGKEFWNPIVKYMEKTLYEKFQTISKSDLNLFKVLDDEKEILKILKKTQTRKKFYS